jgi:hypothetical protein
MFQTKVVDKIKTHILCSIIFFRKSCCLWFNVEKYGTDRQATDDNIIRRMRFACWITKATDTHSQYVILIAFPRQQSLRERASILSYTYIACLVERYLYPISIAVFNITSVVCRIANNYNNYNNRSISLRPSRYQRLVTNVTE